MRRLRTGQHPLPLSAFVPDTSRLPNTMPCPETTSGRIPCTGRIANRRDIGNGFRNKGLSRWSMHRRYAPAKIGSKLGEAAFQDVDRVSIRSDDAAVIRAYRDPAAWEDVWTRSDGSLLMERWVVTSEGLK